MDPIVIGGWVGLTVTTVTGGVAVIRSLIRGPKEDKSLETDIQNRVTAMAERWLKLAEDRLVAAESKADAASARTNAAEEQVGRLSSRVSELEHNLFSALDTIGILWPWGLNGGGAPEPVLPAWIFEWLHKQSKGS